MSFCFGMNRLDSEYSLDDGFLRRGSLMRFTLSRSFYVSRNLPRLGCRLDTELLLDARMRP